MPLASGMLAIAIPAPTASTTPEPSKTTNGLHLSAGRNLIRLLLR